MVKNLSEDDKKAVSKAVTEAERRTSAEIAIVVAPASDSYHAYLLPFGFALGVALTGALWWKKALTDYPSLLLLLALSMGFAILMPGLKDALLRLVPRRILHKHAARRAGEEYLALARLVPAPQPVVLLYVSLAERYAHILHGHGNMVAQKIPAEIWDGILSEFAKVVKGAGLKEAAVTAIRRIAGELEPHFPDQGERNIIPDGIVGKN